MLSFSTELKKFNFSRPPNAYRNELFIMNAEHTHLGVIKFGKLSYLSFAILYFSQSPKDELLLGEPPIECIYGPLVQSV